MNANDRQVGGDHYKSDIQHWDYVVANNLDYFQAQITKYVTRWKKKDGIEALEKARHFLDKYIEMNKARIPPQMSRDASAMPPKLQKLADRLPDLTGQKNPFGWNPHDDVGK